MMLSRFDGKCFFFHFVKGSVNDRKKREEEWKAKMAKTFQFKLKMSPPPRPPTNSHGGRYSSLSRMLYPSPPLNVIRERQSQSIP